MAKAADTQELEGVIDGLMRNIQDGASKRLANKTYLTATQVKDRYKISEMTLWRWMRQEDMGFPSPLVIGRRRLFDEAELIAWDRQKSVKPAIKAVNHEEQKPATIPGSYVQMLAEPFGPAPKALPYEAVNGNSRGRLLEEINSMGIHLIAKLRVAGVKTRDRDIAIERVEEALMWTEKHFKRGW
jgi:predicted DNA-binding transcriptional regulator AlpA